MTVGTDPSLTGLDLAWSFFYFLKIDYVPQLPEEYKFGYIPWFHEERKLLCSSVPHGSSALMSKRIYVPRDMFLDSSRNISYVTLS
jgi:hypothetical protein